MKKISNRPELLSPAGNWESLHAAVINGADALYLGTKQFNARLYSRNFSIEELEKVIDYAHKYGVYVYLTLNILVKNYEIKQFFDLLSRAYVTGIDGVIIQHISFLDIIKANFPGLKVFISTQAAVTNLHAAGLVKKADRIILPRELSLDEVKQFTSAGYDVEVFVHGALCFSYSGLCLFSSFVGNRSGNRGSCAQLCRQKYNGSYPLSTRELCLVSKIPELINTGINGFKIEGRMRSPLYVAVATRLYRKAIDSFLSGKFNVPYKEMEEIKVVFNREFTEGFMFGDINLISSEKPMNRGAFLGEIKDGKLLLTRPISTGDGIGIWHNDKVTGKVVRALKVNGHEVKSAQAGECVGFETLLPENSKIYLTSSSNIRMKPDFQINRSPLPKTYRENVKINFPAFPAANSSTDNSTKILVKAYSAEEAIACLTAGAHTVFLNVFSSDFSATVNKAKHGIIGAYIPRILNQEELIAAIDLVNTSKPPAILVGNSGFFYHRLAFRTDVYADYSLNAFNDLDIQFFNRFNVIPVMSPELSLSELTRLQTRNVVLFCHGDIVVVNTKIFPGYDRLIDEHNNVFKIRKENNYWQILNSRPFGLFEDIKKLFTLGFRQYLIDYEKFSPDYVRLYINILNGTEVKRKQRKGYTSGHLYRPVM